MQPPASCMACARLRGATEAVGLPWRTRETVNGMERGGAHPNYRGHCNKHSGACYDIKSLHLITLWKHEAHVGECIGKNHGAWMLLDNREKVEDDDEWCHVGRPENEQISRRALSDRLAHRAAGRALAVRERMLEPRVGPRDISRHSELRLSRTAPGKKTVKVRALPLNRHPRT